MRKNISKLMNNWIFILIMGIIFVGLIFGGTSFIQNKLGYSVVKKEKIYAFASIVNKESYVANAGKVFYFQYYIDYTVNDSTDDKIKTEQVPYNVYTELNIYDTVPCTFYVTTYEDGKVIADTFCISVE